MSHKYVAFLKLKQNEIAAVCELDPKVRQRIMPFFDLPRPKESSEEEILERIRIALKNIGAIADVPFYLDNFDLDDTILLNGNQQYAEILDYFSEFKIIPVTGLYRDPNHNTAAIAYAAKTKKRIALRLTTQDIESYGLSHPYILDLYTKFELAGIDEIDLFLDLRVINLPPNQLTKSAIKFMDRLDKDFEYSRVALAGSSIPASVTDILKTKTSLTIDRLEWDIWKRTKLEDESERNWLFGDYGVVSPEYTDMELDFKMVQNVATPKVFYTFDNKFFAVRGGAFKTHPKKYGQYFNIADVLVDQTFFRPIKFSFGEKYITERSYKSLKKAAKGGSPSSWLKATLASHMTFIAHSV